MKTVPSSEWQKFDDYCEKIYRADISDFDKFNTACTLAMCMMVGPERAVCPSHVGHNYKFRELIIAFDWCNSGQKLYWADIYNKIPFE